MPRQSGFLTPEERRKAEEWIRERWSGDPRCPVSGHDEWIVAERLITAPFYQFNALAATDAGFPLVALVCAGCGYTRFFNAVLMGLMDTAEEADNG